MIIVRIKLNEEINVKQLAQCLTNTQPVVGAVVVLLEGRDVAFNPFISTLSLSTELNTELSTQMFYSE